MKTFGFPGKEKEQQRSCNQQQNRPGRFKVKYLRTLTLKVTLERLHPGVANMKPQPECAPHMCFVWPVKKKINQLKNQQNYIKIYTYGFPSKFRRFGISGWHSHPATTDCVGGAASLLNQSM